MRRYQFTSESVTEGHPDKVCDQISDAILDGILAQDPKARVACETLVKTGMAVVAGEITTSAWVEMPTVVRNTIKDIGYTDAAMGFDYNTCAVLTAIEKQGAGDQGLMFGFACDETPELMPLPIALAHRLARRLTAVRKSGVVPYLRPDGKTQVTIEYVDGKPARLDTVVVSTQHAEDIDIASLLTPDIAEHVVAPEIADLGIETEGYRLLVNPTGKFVIGGPMGDAGLSGR